VKYVTSGETARRRDGYGEIGKIDLDFEARLVCLSGYGPTMMFMMD